MPQKKVYEQLEAVVAPSKVNSIEFNNSNPARYRIRHCMGKVGQAIRYSTNTTLITFMSKDANGKTTEGLQVEQLAIVMRNFLAKQPNPDTTKIAALDTFLGTTDSTEETPAETVVK